MVTVTVKSSNLLRKCQREQKISLLWVSYFNVSYFDIRTKFQVHIICSSRKRMDGGCIFLQTSDFCKVHLNFELYFCDKTWIHFTL